MFRSYHGDLARCQVPFRRNLPVVGWIAVQNTFNIVILGFVQLCE